MQTFHSTNATADSVQEPKVEAPRSKDTYRAPRLVSLGTAESLVRGGVGTPFDSNFGTRRMFQRP